jgi:peptidoglycan biosynthesis protein MviN/MurJ (putative lipid II flippase)
MQTLGITFMLIVWGLYSFILLFERKIFAKVFADNKKYDPDKIMVLLSRAHWFILALSLTAVFMGVLVNHSKNF